MTAADVSTLVEKLSALKSRVQELEDVREILDIWHHWDWSVTGGFNGIQAGDYQSLLADFDLESGTIEAQRLYERGAGPTGREEVLQYWDYFYGDHGPVPIDFQTAVDPSVRIDGDTAILECNEILWVQYRGGGEPLFGIVKRYIDFARKTDGWKVVRAELEEGLWTRSGPLDPRTHLNDSTKHVPRPDVNTMQFKRPTSFEKNIVRHGRQDPGSTNGS